jgi:outer membrane protein assembly factor BamB
VATGAIHWQKHLLKDFQGNRGTWAYTESPLVDDQAVICTPGGPTATMVALDKKSGTVLWKMEMPERNGAGYASAIAADVGGIRQYIQFLGTGLIGVSARDGKLLWMYNRHIGFASAGTPIFHDGYVFSSASGTQGAGGDALVQLIPDGQETSAKQVYLVRTMLNFHGGVVRVGDFLYGTGASALVCMDFRSGALRWRERSVGKGSLAAAEGHLYVRGEQGEVALVEAKPDGYKEKGRFRQPHRSRFATFCHPVIAGGRLYLRDEDVLLCYDITETR